MGRVKQNFLKMKRCLLSALAVGLCMTANVMAQVPSYVPTNGLVAFYPFSGNANDVSVNGNNGTVSGATLTNDRFGNVAKAYSFYGVDDYISVQTTNMMFDTQDYTISFWFKSNAAPSSGSGGTDVNPCIISRLINSSTFNSVNNIWIVTEIGGSLYHATDVFSTVSVVTGLLNTNWHNLTYTKSMGTYNTYLDGQLWTSTAVSGTTIFNNYPIRFGRSQHTYWKDFTGELDDIGFWNRALTQQEITNLYNGCTENEITTQPTNSVNSIGSNAQFSVNAVAGSAFQWQSNPSNFGWLNVLSNANYSGGTTNTLTVNNVQLANHNQPFRVIASNGNCVDTSNITTIQIADTCITNVTVYDTLLTTVTDTLIINTTLSLPAPNNENTILIYPNPASDHITIDNGNYTAMASYTIKIENNAGQQVFQSLINQAQFYVDLSTWSGNGLYFVHLIDAQGNTVTVRKIVLQ